MNVIQSQAAPDTLSRPAHMALLVLQVLLGIFFVIASAVPKLVGEAIAVQIFEDIGIGQWFRYVVGVLELVGGIGLIIPRTAGLAALGLAVLMVGATITNLFIIDGGVAIVTTIVLFILLSVIAWFRWPQTRSLLGLSE